MHSEEFVHFCSFDKSDNDIIYKSIGLVYDGKPEECIELISSITNYDNEISKKIMCELVSKSEEEILEIKKYKDKSKNEPQQQFVQQPINIPKCPTCQSTNLKRISGTSKAVNTIAFGLLGTKRHKTFHCNSCGYEW